MLHIVPLTTAVPSTARRLFSRLLTTSVAASQLPALKLFNSAVRRQRKTAIVSQGQEYSYGQLLEDAVALRNRVGHGKEIDLTSSRRIAFLFPRSYEYVVAQWGVWSAGAVAVPLCTSHPVPELDYTLTDAEADTVIFHPSFRNRIEPLREKLRSLNWIELDDIPVRNTIDDVQFDQVPFLNSNGALIIYTSGTTGKPKGVLTTHANIEAQVESLLEAWKWTEDDKIIHVLPLHHVHGLINVLTCALWAGATCEFLEPFNADATWQRWMSEKKDLSLFMAVPTIYSKLAHAYHSMSPEEQTKATEACRPFRLMVSGSAALPETVFAEWERISGHRLLERYGMTEIGMALGNPYEGPRIPGTVGRPFPGVQVRIENEHGQNVVDQPDEAGELVIGGPQVFKEYWNKPEATRKEKVNGWFRTGDIVSRSQDGVFRILGRASVDIIKTGGYKVSALDIEREMLEHSAFRDVAVVGLPSEEWGEVVGAMVVLRQGHTIELSDLREFLKERLASYKIPRVLKVVDELPRNAMGKVNKKALRALF
ncbi:uncharacterized protein SPPG_04016 [Spizellomyces punctatus DAOM BR117]|uniref:O-succinylbenzoate-CoA ligase n=1 Tax=Spizellomyces punctatus (strain DAOM BR117) TaxID=645134 RepID=A0A0L0HHH9_SPIPD|nr:uncharacterized protein SPPG_04016 [Spizellomyces punctatus DAOM BR117]KND00916.1 hypothetical protein SPPG_04016 [Spizellomyces punctatus DAOM BR117]|eukprot:XP_016608955.1 hypothetical protein SPPG_04016 [Spizellomyces punctatus DAOM BR117]